MFASDHQTDSSPLSLFILVTITPLCTLSDLLDYFWTSCIYLFIIYIRHCQQRDPYPFLFGSPASSSLAAFSIAVALTVGKDPPRELIFRHVTHNIGHFGLPLDSSASTHISAEDPLSPASSDYHSVHMSPSEMLKDSPVHIGCVIALKNAVDETKSQNDATHHLLQDILTKLGPVQPQNAPNPTTYWPSLSPAPSAGQKKNFLKPAPPSNFSGDYADGKVFLTFCQTYICLCPEAFDNKDTKIVWAMSYMKSCHTGCWTVWEFEHESKNGTLRFIDWLNFEQEFQRTSTHSMLKLQLATC